MADPEGPLAHLDLEYISCLHDEVSLDRPLTETERRDRLGDEAHMIISCLEVALSPQAPQASARQACDLIGLLGKYAPPEDMVDELGKVVSRLDAAFQDIAEQPPREESYLTLKLVGPSPTSSIAERICLVIRTYAAVIHRLRVANAADKSLGKLTDDLEEIWNVMAENKSLGGVELRPNEMRQVITELCAFTQTAAQWSHGIPGADELKVGLARLLSMAVAGGAEHLQLNLIGVWFTLRCPERIPDDLQHTRAHLRQMHLDIMNRIVAAFAALDYGIPRQLQIISSPQPSDMDPFTPTVAMLIIAYRVVGDNPILFDNPFEGLRLTMTQLQMVLKSNGWEAGATWLSEVIKRIREQQQIDQSIDVVDGRMARELIESVMDAMMSAPVNIAMQAQRRLLSEIVSAVQVPSTQLELWVYMTTTANPFELVRATSLGLLREAVRKALEHEPAPVALGPDLEMFLKTRILVIPQFQPPLQSSSLVMARDHAWTIWFTEAASLLHLLFTAPSDPLNMQSLVARASLRDRFFRPLSQMFGRWLAEVERMPNSDEKRRSGMAILLLQEQVAKVTSVLI